MIEESGDFATRKAANAVRVRLASLLGVPRLYELDRLDLAVKSTLDGDLQQKVTDILRELKEPEYARAAGLYGERLLGAADPGKIIYSFTLHELTPEGAKLRIQADNYDQPFDINQGTKLDLGSTAKLRTLVTYLEIIEKLHQQYAAARGRVAQGRGRARRPYHPLGDRLPAAGRRQESFGHARCGAGAQVFG